MNSCNVTARRCRIYQPSRDKLQLQQLHCGLLSPCPRRAGHRGSCASAHGHTSMGVHTASTATPSNRWVYSFTAASPRSFTLCTMGSTWDRKLVRKQLGSGAGHFLGIVCLPPLRCCEDEQMLRPFTRVAKHKQCSSSNSSKLHHSPCSKRVGSSRNDLQHACSMLASGAAFTCCKALVVHVRAAWRRLHIQWKMNEVYTMFSM